MDNKLPTFKWGFDILSRQELTLEGKTIRAEIYLPKNQKNLAGKVSEENLIDALRNGVDKINNFTILNNTTTIHIMICKHAGEWHVADIREHDAEMRKKALARQALQSMGYRYGWVVMAVKSIGGFQAESKYIRSGTGKFDPKKSNLAYLRKEIEKNFGNAWHLVVAENAPRQTEKIEEDETVG